jgi:hypothetical protein
VTGAIGVSMELELPADCPTSDLRISVTQTVPAESLVGWIEDAGVEGSRLLLSEAAAESLVDKFPLNSKLNEHLESRDLEIRTTDAEPLPMAVVSEQSHFLGVEFADLHRFVGVQDEEFREAFVETFESEFERSDPISLSVPPWGELLNRMEEIVGPETRAQYIRLIDTAAANDIDAVDEVAVAIIATALGGGLQYDISKWGEEVNVASKASFSRRKTKLEDDGVITTEKVPVDVGRPRLRLRLGDRVGELSVDIGVGSRDIDGSEPIMDSDGINDGTPTTDEKEERVGVDQNNSADLISELNEELRSLLSSNGAS